jgi:hypothetical protein
MSDRDILGEARYEVVEEEVEEHTGVDGITEQVLRRPDVLAALQGRLNAEMLEVIVLSVSVKDFFVTWIHVRKSLETTLLIFLCPGTKLAGICKLNSGNTSIQADANSQM